MMMPFGDEKKNKVAVIAMGIPSEGGEREESKMDSESQAALEDAARQVMDAIKSDNVQAFVEAYSLLHDIKDELKETDEDEEESEEEQGAY